jgi:hypothetical protein
MFDGLIREIVDDNGQPSLDNKVWLLERIADHLGLANASYLAVNLPKTTHREFYAQFTDKTGRAEHFDNRVLSLAIRRCGAA